MQHVLDFLQNIFYFVFHRRKKIIQVWNDIMEMDDDAVWI